jgi:hypothetical protein
MALQCAGPLPAPRAAGLPSDESKPLQVMLVLADDRGQSNVRGGENGGRVLTHVAVVRSLAEVGTLNRSGAFSKDLEVNTQKANPLNLRIVAFVQEADGGRAVGVASARLTN